MKKEKMKAQLRFHKKDDGREGYAINIFSEGEWNIESWFPLFAKENGNGDTDFVHWSILQKLAELQNLGYEIDLQF